MNKLPIGWSEASIEELAGAGGLMVDGDWIETKDQNPKGDVRLIQLQDVGDGYFVNKSKRFLTSRTAERLRCTFLKPGDILIARMPDPIGRACIFPDLERPCVTAVDVCVWRSGQVSANPQWLMNVINSPDVRQEIASKAGGTTRQRISGGNLKRIVVPVPPAAEQLRIAKELSGLTTRLERAGKELALIPLLIGNYRRAALSAAYGGTLTQQWRAQRNLPEWTSVNLENIVSDIRYGTSKKCHTEPKGTAVLRIPNVSDGRVDLTDLKYAELPENDLNKLRLKKGDILVVRSNGSPELVGRPALISDSEVGLAYAGYLIRLRPRLTEVVPQFLTYMLNAPQTREVIEVGARSTSGVHNLNATELSAMIIPVPSLEEQVEIVRLLDHTLSWLQKVNREYLRAVELLPRLKSEILRKAFQGDLAPQDPRDEPASILLIRTRARPAASAATTKSERSKATRSGPVKTSRRKVGEMGKMRSEVQANHLQETLRKLGGSAKARQLWQDSDMDIDEFYKQLRSELKAGRIREGASKDDLVLAHAA